MPFTSTPITFAPVTSALKSLLHQSLRHQSLRHQSLRHQSLPHLSLLHQSVLLHVKSTIHLCGIYKQKIFRVLVANWKAPSVLYNRTEHSQGFSICFIIKNLSNSPSITFNFQNKLYFQSEQRCRQHVLFNK